MSIASHEHRHHIIYIIWIEGKQTSYFTFKHYVAKSVFFRRMNAFAWNIAPLRNACNHLNHWYLLVQLKFTKWYKFKLTFPSDSFTWLGWNARFLLGSFSLRHSQCLLTKEAGFFVCGQMDTMYSAVSLLSCEFMTCQSIYWAKIYYLQLLCSILK